MFTSNGPRYIVMLVVLCWAGPISAQFAFTTFDYPASSNTVPTGINNLGLITGSYYIGGWHNFLRSADGTAFSSFDYPGSFQSFAHGINDSGQVSGSYPYDAAGSGFLRSSDGSTYSSFDDPAAFGESEGGGFGTVARGINNSGQIAGYYYTNNSFHGLVRSADGTIYSSFDDPDSAMSQSVTNGINNSGQTTGHYYDATGMLHGYLLDGGTLTNFEDPNASTRGTTAWGINDSGQIVGYYGDAAGIYHGYLRNSDGSFVTVDVPNATTGTFPAAINNAGMIVGSYNDSSGTHGFIATPLPVPKTKDDCKNDGWETHYRADGTTFKNQGDCIQYVNTGK